MLTGEIRAAFVDFFTERGHTPRPSASLIPTDPTLLLTGAGMVPFKPYFLGEEPAPWPRAVSIQKCVRTVDIDLIGTTTRHLTMFEMLGNFSFGDYFKERAIRFSYDFITGPLGVDPDRLWFTVYETDDEAAEVWLDGIGVPPARLQRGGEDNFWQMGVAGPCGPASEIFIDRGPDYGPEGGPIGGGEERYVELWNLVFMQNIQDEPYNVVGDLPAKSIDTGTGLERLAMVLQDKKDVFEVDAVWAVLRRAGEALGVAYGEAEETDVMLRMVADHARASAFLIGDRVTPANEGRGYIVRRLIRRAVRSAWQMGGEGMIMPALAEATAGVMAGAYPELASNLDFILEVTEREEGRFRRTLSAGAGRLEEALSRVPEGGLLDGAEAFRLHDTYGFPIHLTEEMAAERGRGVDADGFAAEMSRQRARAKSAWKGGAAAVRSETYLRVLDEVGPTGFVGYERDRVRAKVTAIMADGELIPEAPPGREVEVFLDRSPFYAEAGGQVGDRGRLEGEGVSFAVSDTQAAVPALHGHRGRAASGGLTVGCEVEARIDAPRRDRIRKAHTGTHLLHWALRETLGEHVHQAGSLVEDGRFRFDFNHFAPLAPEEIREMEEEVNRRIADNHRVSTLETDKDQAEEMGALAFFGDKYGERVRVVTVGDFSVELCGGTHVGTCGEVGPLLILSESSIGSNLRRAEALTGMSAYRHLREVRDGLADVGRTLGVGPSEVPARVRALAERAEEMAARLKEQEQSGRSQRAAELAGRARRTNGTPWVVAGLEDQPPDALREVGAGVRDRLGSGVVALGARNGGKGGLVALVSKDLAEAGVSAAELAAPGARVLGGGGSRDPELSQAGGPRGEKMAEALEAVREEVVRRLSAL